MCGSALFCSGRALMEDINMYTSNDLYLTAFLIAKGNRLDSYVQQNGKTVFRLLENDKLNDLINDYYSGRGMVSGLVLNNALKNLKNLLFTNKDIYGKQQLTNIKG